MTEASLFYETASGGLGREFLDEVQRVIDTLGEHPKLGNLAGRGLRQAAFRRFPYWLIYAEEPDAILVIAVAHQRRRPSYWRRRMVRP